MYVVNVFQQCHSLWFRNVGLYAVNILVRKLNEVNDNVAKNTSWIIKLKIIEEKRTVKLTELQLRNKKLK